MDANNSTNKELSTTILAKELKMTSKAMFQQLVEVGLILRNGDTWELTQAGKSKGGIYKQHEKWGRYIVWPESIINDLDDTQGKQNSNMVTTTYISEKFDIPANRINSIMSELGWLNKDPIKGWLITNFGKRLGGIQARYKTTGIPFVRWPESVINNQTLITSINEAKGDNTNIKQETVEGIGQNQQPDDFRDKYKPENRAKDGHNVRSKSELIIDNWLYDSKIVHAYERKLPVEETLYCDFYIPTGKVYIEYWGLDDDKYKNRKNIKLGIYKKYNLNLIELFEKDVSNLDDTLPAKLLEFHIAVE
jgi:hypothetical protein